MRNFDDIDIVKIHPIQNSEHILVIHTMERADFDEWAKEHHPESKKNKRTDGEWSWFFIFIASVFFNFWGQKVKGYVYRINGEIYGISTIAYEYPCSEVLKESSQQIKPYLWHIVKSPHYKRILSKVNIDPQYVKLQKYVYDIIYEEIKNNPLTDSLETIWLHADPNGKDELLKVYEDKGFVSCPLFQDKLLKFRKDDGRYLYLPEEKFSQFSIPSSIGEDDV